MIIQKEIQDSVLAQVLENIKEEELAIVLESYMQENKRNLLKVGKNRPFKPFKPIKMMGKGPTASEMVIEGRI